MAVQGTGVDLSMYDHRSMSANSQEEVDLTQTVSLPFLSRGMLPRVEGVDGSQEKKYRAGQSSPRATNSAPPSISSSSSSGKSNERTALLPPVVPVVQGGNGDRCEDMSTKNLADIFGAGGLEAGGTRTTEAVPPGEDAVLHSQEVAQRMPSEEEKDDTDSEGAGFCAWLRQYAAKASGGPVPKSEPFNQWDAFVVWGGVFGSLALLELALTILNGAHYRNEDNLFVLSGSFGALCTLLYAVPGGKLGQPRIMFAAHTMAIVFSLMTISVSTPGRMVWLQEASTVASTILGMSLMNIIHPPAGALVLVFLAAHNKGASMERIFTLVASVYVGLIIHMVMSILVNNLSPRRKFPTFW